MVEDAEKVLSQDRRSVEAHRRQYLSGDDSDSVDPEEEEESQNEGNDNMIHVGDINMPIQPQGMSIPAQSQGMSKLAKAAVTAALVLGTGGAAAGVGGLVSSFLDTDTDTRQELRIADVPGLEKSR